MLIEKVAGAKRTVRLMMAALKIKPKSRSSSAMRASLKKSKALDVLVEKGHQRAAARGPKARKGLEEAIETPKLRDALKKSIEGVSAQYERIKKRAVL